MSHDTHQRRGTQHRTWYVRKRAQAICIANGILYMCISNINTFSMHLARCNKASSSPHDATRHLRHKSYRMYQPIVSARPTRCHSHLHHKSHAVLESSLSQIPRGVIAIFIMNSIRFDKPTRSHTPHGATPISITNPVPCDRLHLDHTCGTVQHHARIAGDFLRVLHSPNSPLTLL